MKFIVTSFNKANRTGVFDTVSKPDIRKYLLGKIKYYTEVKHIHFIPKYFTHKASMSKGKYISRYCGVANLKYPYGHLIPPRRAPNRMFRADQIYIIVNQIKLKLFNDQVKQYFIKNPKFLTTDKSNYYKHFPIPKKRPTIRKDGTLYYKQRPIDEPLGELKELQRKASDILYDIYKIKHHNAAHAYVKKRDNVTNAKTHKYSKHFLLMDFKNFFPSINKSFLEKQLRMLKEFAIIELSTIDIQNIISTRNNMLKVIVLYKEITKEFFDNIIKIAIYKDGLPQGSPLSPMLSNIIMTETDIKIQKLAYSNNFCRHKIIYTRFADDLAFSSFSPINAKKLIPILEKTLENTPININHKKTKYLTNRKRVYITGVKINNMNEATYGYEKKAELKKDIFNILMAKKNKENITKEAQEVLGRLAYLRKIEPNYGKLLINKYATKFKIPTKEIYKYLIK